MTKAERLLKIIDLLKARRTAVTAAELASQLQVSERTIYRDVQSLELSGVNITGEAGVGYSLRAGQHLAPLTFTENEIEALMLGARFAKTWMQGDIGEAADSALTKIRAVIPEPTLLALNRRVTPYMISSYGMEQTTRHSDDIRIAIVEQCVIQLDYEDAKQEVTQRRIWPLGMLLWGQVATVCAWCELRQAYRMFRLDRIKAVNQTPETFETHDELSFAHYLSQYRPDVDTRFWSV